MAGITRRGMIGAGSGLLATSWLLPWPGLAETPASCEVATPSGRMRGVRTAGVDAYTGIAYGASVSGERRFKPALPAGPWRDVYDATRLGAASLQHGTPWSIGEPPRSEDCLYLNIWAPAGGRRDLPVMFYSHGGGVTMGSGGNIYTLGANLARSQDVVVVTHNHRLGVLGYLYLDALGGEDYAGSGNNGVTDIALALEWVGRNIASFGGNPDNVKIFGESGGGLKTSCLYAMPRAAPHFHKASIESGPGIRLMDREMAAENTLRLLSLLGLGRSNWRDIARVPGPAILDAQEKLAASSDPSAAFAGDKGIGAIGLGGIGPVLDGRVFTAHPFDPAAPAISRDKPLITGGNQDEETYFAMIMGDTAALTLDEPAMVARLTREVGGDVAGLIGAYRQDRPGASPSQIYVAVRSDLFSGIGSRTIAERKIAQGGASVYLYNLRYAHGGTVPGTDYPLGANHGLDMPIKFVNTDPPPAASGLPPLAGLRPERVVAAHVMSSYWAGFARTGRPSAQGLPDWPAYTTGRRPVMNLDTVCSVVDDPRPAARAYWAGRS